MITELDSLGAQDRTRVERAFARGVHALLAADRPSALATVLGLMPRGSSVAHGSSTTLQEIGLVDYLARPDSNYHYLNPEWLAENDAQRRMRMRARLSLEADYFLGSVQAVCETGEAIGTDGSGCRQASYVCGPPNVI